MSGHPRDVKTGGGRLQEFKNTEFIWELRKMGFSEGGCKQCCLLMRVSIRRASVINTYCGLLHIRNLFPGVVKSEIKYEYKSKSQPNFFVTNHISHKDGSNQHFCLHFQPRENLIDTDISRSRRSSRDKHYDSFILSLLLVFLDNCDLLWENVH